MYLPKSVLNSIDFKIVLGNTAEFTTIKLLWNGQQTVMIRYYNLLGAFSWSKPSHVTIIYGCCTRCFQRMCQIRRQHNSIVFFWRVIRTFAKEMFFLWAVFSNVCRILKLLIKRSDAVWTLCIRMCVCFMDVSLLFTVTGIIDHFAIPFFVNEIKLILWFPLFQFKFGWISLFFNLQSAIISFFYFNHSFIHWFHNHFLKSHMHPFSYSLIYQFFSFIQICSFCIHSIGIFFCLFIH